MADENSDLDNLSPAELERMKNELTRELMIETANSGIDFVPFVNSANRFAQGHIVMGFVNLGTSLVSAFTFGASKSVTAPVRAAGI